MINPLKELNYNEAALLAALPKAPSKYNPYRNIELAKFRRDLVLNNLLDNGFISSNEYKELITQKIKLKKTKKFFLEDSQYYIEDVRKNVIDLLTYEKVYKQGFNINTPIDLELQKIATVSLRKGLMEYDKRKGWRGPIANKEYYKDWYKDLKDNELEKSINWSIAIIKKLNQFSAEIETKDKFQGIIEYKDITWTKKFNELLKTGDVIYVEKLQIILLVLSKFKNKWRE